jgi:hypothetical protein
MSEQIGPTVEVNYRCSECICCKSERYVCQGDSGHDVYCENPIFQEKKRIGDTNWNTPDFCPYKKDALNRLFSSMHTQTNFDFNEDANKCFESLDKSYFSFENGSDFDYFLNGLQNKINQYRKMRNA